MAANRVSPSMDNSLLRVKAKVSMVNLLRAKVSTANPKVKVSMANPKVKVNTASSLRVRDSMASSLRVRAKVSTASLSRAMANMVMQVPHPASSTVSSLLSTVLLLGNLLKVLPLRAAATHRTRASFLPSFNSVFKM